MVICPNCNHQNPDGAVQCEACFTPLPTMASCPNCGAEVQTDAHFCGQCGYNLQAAAPAAQEAIEATAFNPPSLASGDLEIPDLLSPDPLIAPDPLLAGSASLPATEAPDEGDLTPPPLPPPAATAPLGGFTPLEPTIAVGPSELNTSPNLNQTPPVGQETAPPPPGRQGGATQLQVQTASLLHVQTNVTVELPQGLAVIHIGKPNDRVPPDVDVSGFPDSDVVSRVHADIRVEGDRYFLEDVGSSNGTYVNNLPLPKGNRHRLRPGDRISLGKGDLVTFLFKLD